MDLNKLQKYAEVVIKRGLFLKEGQPLYIQAPVDGGLLVSKLVEEAYKAGASDVYVDWKCNEVDAVKMKTNHMSDEMSPAEKMIIEDYASRHACYLMVEKVDLDVFKDVSEEMISKAAVLYRGKRTLFSKLSKMAQSTIICVPTPSWAKVVYPDLDEEAGLEKLWEAVFECTRVNHDDPLKAWDDYVESSIKRRHILDGKQYQQYHYTSKETDLYLSPLDRQMWMGGCVEYPNSDEIFIPNVPTEEIFTTPHKYKAQGYVTSTRPLNFNGKLIDHFTLYLKDGKVVDYKADAGYETLKSILEADEGSCYFGEMALVDKNSPISSLKTTFYTTLFDENASCHIALGRAGGPAHLSKEELDALGLNQSSLHVDFMVGSDDMRIQGLTKEGIWEDIFVDGSWTDTFKI